MLCNVFHTTSKWFIYNVFIIYIPHLQSRYLTMDNIFGLLKFNVWDNALFLFLNSYILKQVSNVFVLHIQITELVWYNIINTQISCIDKSLLINYQRIIIYSNIGYQTNPYKIEWHGFHYNLLNVLLISILIINVTLISKIKLI